jgi:hypothetical protein
VKALGRIALIAGAAGVLLGLGAAWVLLSYGAAIIYSLLSWG